MSRQTKPKFEVPNTDPQHLFVWPTVKQDKYQKRLTVSPDSRIVYSAPGGWASAVYWAEPEIQAWKWDSTSNCWIETINFGVLGSRQTNVAFTGPTTAGITLWLCCQDPVPGNGDEEPDDSVIDELQIAPTSQNPANIPDCKSEFDRVGRSSGAAGTSLPAPTTRRRTRHRAVPATAAPPHRSNPTSRPRHRRRPNGPR